jgi:hypothetical protein
MPIRNFAKEKFAALQKQAVLGLIMLQAEAAL